MQYVYPTENLKRYRFPTHINDLVINRSESATSEVFVVVIDKDGAPPLHKHDDTEQIFYIVEGEGELMIGDESETFPVKPGDVVRIPVSTMHTIKCVNSEQLRYIAVDCFTGGRPEAEPTWEAHVRLLCKQQGWDFDSIVE